MKRLTGLSLLFVLFAGLSANAQQTVATASKTSAAKPQKQNALDMRGVYQMTRQVLNDGTRDSLMNIKQLKMYTDRHMVYVHPGPDDSLAVYGVGTYTVENGKVIENVFHLSDTGAVNERYELDIKKSGDGFSQVIHFRQPNNQTFVLTEDYKRINRNVASPLDGAWRQTRRTAVAPDGTTMTMDTPVQFKFYNAGHFLWVSTQKDSATGKPVSYYGYGTFDMTGNNSLVEKPTNSTFGGSLVGNAIKLEIKMLDKNSYQQTIVWGNGQKETEVYQRL